MPQHSATRDKKPNRRADVYAKLSANWEKCKLDKIPKQGWHKPVNPAIKGVA